MKIKHLKKAKDGGITVAFQPETEKETLQLEAIFNSVHSTQRGLIASYCGPSSPTLMYEFVTASPVLKVT